MKRTLIDSGEECAVYDIGGGVCYKRYTTLENAAIAYNNAVKAANANIAPKVYRKGRMGYTTEIVELYSFCKHCQTQSDECDYLCSEFTNAIGRAEYYEMERIACEVFDEDAAADFHNGNIGLKDGKPVMIDFGICSDL